LEAEFRERQALLERATRDALTGLWNRATILDVLSREITQAQRTGSPLSVGVIDVDHFKLINDSHGHLGGDEVLRSLAGRLTAQFRQGDWLGRYGGEELMMVLPGWARAEVQVAAERLRKCISDQPFLVNGVLLNVTISIGIALCETAVDDPESIIARADAALYEAKRAGRNRVEFMIRTGDLSSESRPFLHALVKKVDAAADQRSGATGRG
jgi:diguanylate cyclase (GGDEF)-like protein